MGVLEHTCVESAEDVRGVILSVGGADGCFECRGQVMPIKGVRGASEAGPRETVNECNLMTRSTCPRASMSCSAKSP